MIKDAERRCQCGHVKYEHEVYLGRIERRMKDARVLLRGPCAIKGCVCQVFILPRPQRREKPVPTLDRTEPKLFELDTLSDAV